MKTAAQQYLLYKHEVKSTTSIEDAYITGFNRALEMLVMKFTTESTNGTVTNTGTITAPDGHQLDIQVRVGGQRSGDMA